MYVITSISDTFIEKGPQDAVDKAQKKTESLSKDSIKSHMTHLIPYVSSARENFPPSSMEHWSFWAEVVIVLYSNSLVLKHNWKLKIWVGYLININF
jgi:hypothetical protein